VGIDPSLGAILTARRVSRSLGVSVHFVVADARYLPFPPNHFDQVFSYSVLQHFSLEDCKQSVIEIGRVLKAKGNSIIQMPTKLGIRCLFHQARRGFREARDFEVRYWSLAELKKMFTMAIGQVEFSVDCFFGIGLQPSDYHLMTPKLKAVLLASEVLRKVSNILPFMIRLADSVYVKAIK
jgi:SAM-dependent methyltransferase